MTGLTFDHPTHRYTLDGEIVPSVTGILRASGIVDFSQVPVHTLEAARYRGSIVHEAVHLLNEQDLDLEAFRVDFPGFIGYLEAWLSFCEQRHYVPVLNEHRVASRRHRVAGTLDSLGLLDGCAALLDYATGRPEDVAKDLQTAAYLGLAHEWAEDGETDPPLQRFLLEHPTIKRYAVALRRDGTFKLEPYKDPADFRRFLTLNEAQRIVAAHRGEWLAEVAA